MAFQVTSKAIVAAQQEVCSNRINYLWMRDIFDADQGAARGGLEINHALRNAIPVYELADGQLLPVTKPVRYLNKVKTKQAYLQWKRIHLWHD